MAQTAQAAKADLPGQHSVLHGIWPGNCCLCTHEDTITGLQNEIVELGDKIRDLGGEAIELTEANDALEGDLAMGELAEYDLADAEPKVERLQKVAKAGKLVISSRQALEESGSRSQDRRLSTMHEFNQIQLALHLKDLEPGDLGDHE